MKRLLSGMGRVAAVLAAGADGLERRRILPAKAIGDKYAHPGDAVPLATDMESALTIFQESELAAALGDEFARNFVVLAESEIIRATPEMGDDPDVVTAWERQRYLEHT